jgi:hypothetical protein
MNDTNLFEPAYYLPFVSLAARREQDSGDGDADKFDFIDDTIAKWLPGTKVHKFFDPRKLDFTYAVEDEKQGKLFLGFLGTEGSLLGPGWKSDLSPQVETHSFHDKGGHVDIINAGELVFDYYEDLLYRYRFNTVFATHSRGVRGLATGRKMQRVFGEGPRRMIAYCPPKIFNAAGADELDKCGLSAPIITVISPHDLVDNIGTGRHVGQILRLPDAHAAITEHAPTPVFKHLLGQLLAGHAYSSVFACMELFCEQRRYDAEVSYLHEREWVCTI